MATLADPKSVKVNVTTGTGMDIEWKDGHRSVYSFPFLRDACPCALCNEEREKDGRKPGDPAWKVSPPFWAIGLQSSPQRDREELENFTLRAFDFYSFSPCSSCPPW